MDAKHTPGPWTIVDKGSDARCAHIRGEFLRIVVDHREDFGDPLPDALLIAAVPDMLAALRHFERVYDRTAEIPTRLEEGEVVLSVRAALAKVEGRR